MPAHLAQVTTPSPRKRRPTGLIVTILCLSGTVVALQQTMVVPLLPDFPQILHTTADDVSWLVTATLLTSAVATPIVSRLADMFGKRRMMLVAMVMMVIGSVIAAAGGSFGMLVVGRAFQGFAASLIPVGISIMRDELPKERVPSAVALMSATLGIGSALGLPLSGLIYQALGWQAIFVLSAIIGVLLIGAVLLIVPESAVRTRGKFDFLGAVMLSIALTALLLAISKGGSWGWTSEPTLLMFLTTVVMLGLWFPYELRVSSPMVDLRTSARRPVLFTNIASVLVGFSMYANMLSTTQQLQMPTVSGYGFGLSVIVAGLCMVPSGLAMVALAPISALITKRFGAKATLIVGAAVLAGSYIFRVFFNADVWMIVVGAMAVSMGTAIAYAAMPTLIMRSVPITETASANGLNSLLRAVGTSTASATVAAVLTSVTLQAGGVSMPALDAFKDIFWLAGAAAILSIGATAFIPTFRTAAQLVTTDNADLLISGVVRRPDDRPIRNAVVSVMGTDGEAVDWSRADNDGVYSVVLPSAGKYLVVTSADGWAPHAQVLEFSASGADRSLVLPHRLSISGQVTGAPLTGARKTEEAGSHQNALVTLTKPTGESVTATYTDATGRYSIPLPSAGHYIVTMLDASGERAQSRQLTVTGLPTVVDFNDSALVNS